jgi:hypothetical protein
VLTSQLKPRALVFVRAGGVALVGIAHASGWQSAPITLDSRHKPAQRTKPAAQIATDPPSPFDAPPLALLAPFVPLELAFELEPAAAPPRCLVPVELAWPVQPPRARVKQK